jgi:hypothetical protein
VLGPEYGFIVGEHVWVDGREGEFVVMDVDHENSRLQILEVGQVARLESVPATSVRVVLPPKSEPASSGELEHTDPRAAA